ncbi:MAG: hypothetical protein ACLGI2_11875 [Acidimicrobiia bacterium]
MGGLGDLLELLHGAGDRWTTVRLALRTWSDSDLMRQAMQRHARASNSRGATVVTSSRGHRGGPSTWEATVRAWLDRPGDRRRIEVTDGHGERLTVQAGERWWSYMPLIGSMSNEGDPEVGTGGGAEYDWLVEPWSLVPGLALEPVGAVEVAGREAIDVRATPRPFDPRLGFVAHLAPGADEVALAVDRERGVVLRCESRLDGRPFTLHEVTEIAFDEPLADDLFRFESPDGSPVRSPRETYARPEPVSIEEAARRASFTVLVPTRLPRGWGVDALYSPAGDRPARRDWVTLHVRPEDRMAPRLRLHQSATPMDDMLDWEQVDHRGRRILLYRSGMPGTTWEAKIEGHGTHVRASGDLDREAVLEIVSSLEPAPRHLPPIG